MEKRYLVTGGAGFIGSNFIRHLLDTHGDILVVNVDKLTYAGNLENLASVMDDRRHLFVQEDICDREAMQRLFAAYDFDYVVNFAAESHVDRSIKDPGIFARTNVEGTLSLLDAARKRWQDGRPGAKFLQVSTDEVYGSLEGEGFFTERTPLDPHSPYSASKASADLFVQAYATTYGLPVNITRCSNNYGPCQFPEKLIPLMINNCMHGKELPIYGDGLQVRDWLYVEDHCKAIGLVLEKGRCGEVYNVGGHNERTNLQIVQTIVSHVRKEVDPAVSLDLVRHVTDRKGHDRRYAIDAGKLKRELGWEPETRFEEGIGKTIAWYLENPSWMEHVTSGDYLRYYETMYAKG
jgi:dTDP-glucose 4,6-dehydratase